MTDRTGFTLRSLLALGAVASSLGLVWPTGACAPQCVGDLPCKDFDATFWCFQGDDCTRTPETLPGCGQTGCSVFQYPPSQNWQSLAIPLTKISAHRAGLSAADIHIDDVPEVVVDLDGLPASCTEHGDALRCDVPESAGTLTIRIGPFHGTSHVSLRVVFTEPTCTQRSVKCEEPPP